MGQLRLASEMASTSLIVSSFIGWPPLKLFLMPHKQGIYAFLDSQCLIAGMNWKDGFLQGLLHSKTFLAVISSAGLERCRNISADHTHDHVLLEFETALKISATINDDKYISPVFVGSYTENGSLFEKFSDFDPLLYSDSLTAQQQHAGEVTEDDIREAVEVLEEVTRTPRSILSDILVLPGVVLDPHEVSTAVTKLIDNGLLKAGYGDGVTKFDCFISYRVATERDVATQLYYDMKLQGIHPFLDSKCLIAGMNWKEGFLKGLLNSRTFLAVISSAGLERCRNSSADHTHDHVLLEFETALKISASTNNPSYICPVLVGSYTVEGYFAKFTDFHPSLYSDSLTGEPEADAAVSSSSLLAEESSNEEELDVLYPAPERDGRRGSSFSVISPFFTARPQR